MGAKDENDRRLEGSLTSDPSAATARVAVESPVRASLALVADNTPTAPPSDLQAEAALLGGLIWHGTFQDGLVNMSCVQDLLTAKWMFFTKAHCGIFDAIKALHERKIVADATAVQSELIRARVALPAGYIDTLLSGATAPSEALLREYATAVRDAYLLRLAIGVGQKLIEAARAGRWSPLEIATRTIERMNQIVADSTAVFSDVVPMSTAVDTVMQRVINRVPEGSVLTTGIPELDGYLIGGLRRKQVSVIAARTSVGKSALALQMMLDSVATFDGDAGLYITLEMPAEQFVERLLAARARVSMRSIISSAMDGPELGRVVGESKAARELPIFFNRKQNMNMVQIRAMAKNVRDALARTGRRLAMLVVDHVALVRSSGRFASRAEEISSVMRDTHLLAEELDCHIIVLVQISRESERQSSKDKLPQLHHMKGSGSLEEDADNVFILHRGRDAQNNWLDEPARLSAAKVRQGVVGLVWLDFDASQMRFSQWNGSANAKRLGSAVAKEEEQ